MQEDSLVRNFKAYMKTELEGKTKKKEPQHSAEEWAEKFHEVRVSVSMPSAEWS